MSRDQRLDQKNVEKADAPCEERPGLTALDAYGPPRTAGKQAAKPGDGAPARSDAPPASVPAEACIRHMRVSEKGLKTIEFYEGLRLKPYQDMGHKSAIGYGHHILAGEDFSKGITQAEAEALLRKDLKVARHYVADLVKVPLKQGQYDALVSFVFNVGSTNFAESTLLRKLNKGDYEGAAREFKHWNQGGRPKRVLKGLVERREAERSLFQSG